jgi:hypothetical protein
MARSVPVNLGRCSMQQADQLGKIFEFLPILGLRHLLANVRHEVRFHEYELIHNAAHD